MQSILCFLLLVDASAFLSDRVADKAGADISQQAQWEKEVDAILANMTLGEKAAQMLQIEAGAVDMDTYLPFVGAVMYSGNQENNNNKKEDWYWMAEQLQKKASVGPHGVPIFIGADSVHGQSHLKGTTVFPHNINLGCSRNKTLVEMIAKATAVESSATGINYIFAPCLDIVQDVRWGRTYESFSQDPQVVNELGAAFVEGAQSVDTGMLTSAKHFVAAGATKYGTGYFIEPEEVGKIKDDLIQKMHKEHPKRDLKSYDPKVEFTSLPRKPLDRGNALLDKSELYTKHMLPYWGAVSAGTGSVMTSYSSVNGVPNHANRELLGYLKGSHGMNYDGFVITDYAGIDMIDRDYSKSLPKAINAGIDMVMLPGTETGCKPWLEGACPTAQSFVKDMIKHVQEGTIKNERVNDAVKRIIMAKKKHGLFKQALAPKNWLKRVGSHEHMQLAREAAQQGTTILTNKGNTLPLSKKDVAYRLCVAGETANNLGMQLGGWSVKWQGFMGNNGTTGKTLWNEVKKRVEGAKYDKTGECKGASTVLAVVGELPYAEGYGDVVDKKGLMLREADFKMLAKVFTDHTTSSLLEEGSESEEGSNGKRVILVTMSGRPQWMAQSIKKADAFVASFVPGVMGGAGLLDVLLGEVPATGKLSVTWPADMKAPVNEHSPSSDVLFEMGSGLRYDGHEL